MASSDFPPDFLLGLRFRVPDGDIPSDIGQGSAHSVYLLPSEVECDHAIFVGEGRGEDLGGYAIPIDDLRNDLAGVGWAAHIGGKAQKGQRPAWVVLAAALAEKARVLMDESSSDS